MVFLFFKRKANINFLFSILFNGLLTFLVSLYFAWWSIVLVSFFVHFFFKQKPLRSFFSGFLSVFLLWLGLNVYLSLENNHILEKSVSLMFFNFYIPYFLNFFSGFIGGVVSGLGALTASHAAAILKANREEGQPIFGGVENTEKRVVVHSEPTVKFVIEGDKGSGGYVLQKQEDVVEIRKIVEDKDKIEEDVLNISRTITEKYPQLKVNDRGQVLDDERVEKVLEKRPKTKMEEIREMIKEKQAKIQEDDGERGGGKKGNNKKVEKIELKGRNRDAVSVEGKPLVSVITPNGALNRRLKDVKKK